MYISLPSSCLEMTFGQHQCHIAINKHDRQHLMSLCQGLVFADTVEKNHVNETQMQTDKTVLKYRNFYDYIKNALERKEQWALRFRKGLLTRGNNTDNFTESMIFVFKCVILKRIRAYNSYEIHKAYQSV